MKIIGISTSPRKGSNSRFALETALKTAQEKGAHTKLYDLNELNISTCQADDYCSTHEGKCSLKDGLQDVFSDIYTSDGIILASPVYMGNISSNAKIFLDRCYALMHSDILNNETKNFSMILSQGAIEPAMYEYIKHNIDIVADIFRGIGFKVIDVEILKGNLKPNETEKKESQISTAKTIGEKIYNFSN